MKTFALWTVMFAAAVSAAITVSAQESGSPEPANITDVRAGSDDRVFAAALQADGKIVLAGSSTAPGGPSSLNFAVARYNPDLTLDTSFGVGGVTLTDIRDSTDVAHAVAIQADGKIVAAGSTNAPDGNPNIAVIRYNLDGTVDPTFGDNTLGPGRVITDVYMSSVDEAFAMAIQPDGKIIVVGETDAPGANPTRNTNVVMIRYTPDGGIDIPFGDNVYPGRVITTLPNFANERAQAVALQPDGKIVVAGDTNYPVENANFNFLVLRYGADGILDATFGVGGGSVTDISNQRSDEALAVGMQGTKIVAAGTTNAPSGDDNFAVVRYNEDGGVDPTFASSTNTPGRSVTDFGGNSSDQVSAMVILPDGRIVLGGQSTNPPLPTSDQNFALVRYSVDGVADTGFGINNRVLTNIGTQSGTGTASEDHVTTLALQPDGKIIAGGDTNAPNVDFNFVLERYLP